MSNSSIQVCPVERSGALDNKLRKLLQNPQKIVGSYIMQDMTVLDFGCGPGFFSIEIAKMLSDKGKVISVDLQQGMLDKLKNKISGSFLEPKIQLHQCVEDKIGLSEPVDFALAFYVVHEVPDKVRIFEELYTLLRPGGHVFVAEPLFHVPKRNFENMLDIASGFGFKIIEKPKLFFSRAVLLRK